MGFSVFFPRGQMPIHASMSEFHDLEVLSLADDKERLDWAYWMGKKERGKTRHPLRDVAENNVLWTEWFLCVM